MGIDSNSLPLLHYFIESDTESYASSNELEFPWTYSDWVRSMQEEAASSRTKRIQEVFEEVEVQNLIENFKEIEKNQTKTMGKRLSGRMTNKTQQKIWRNRRQEWRKVKKVMKKKQKTWRKELKKEVFIDMEEMKIKNRLEMLEYCSGSLYDEEESIKNHKEETEPENVANHDEEEDDFVHWIPILIDQVMELKNLEEP